MSRHALACLARPWSSSGHQRSPSRASVSRSVTKHWRSGTASSPSLIACLSARPIVCTKYGRGPNRALSGSQEQGSSCTTASPHLRTSGTPESQPGPSV
eukprot:3925192-Pyramimonas_sp.AAC.2